jgi:hypothetical protein
MAKYDSSHQNDAPSCGITYDRHSDEPREHLSCRHHLRLSKYFIVQATGWGIHTTPYDHR